MHTFKGISELFAHLYSPGSPALPRARSSFSLLPLPVFIFFFFFSFQQPPFSFPSHLHLLMCQCGPPATRLAEESRSPPRLCPARPHACHCSALCATLACFVNNHLFVAGIVAAITSDLPVSSIMDRLLDVNICKSLLLNSPPGWD